LKFTILTSKMWYFLNLHLINLTAVKISGDEYFMTLIFPGQCLVGCVSSACF
jgi:hypothetical protein